MKLLSRSQSGYEVLSENFSKQGEVHTRCRAISGEDIEDIEKFKKRKTDYDQRKSNEES